MKIKPSDYPGDTIDLTSTSFERGINLSDCSGKVVILGDVHAAPGTGVRNHAVYAGGVTDMKLRIMGSVGFPELLDDSTREKLAGLNNGVRLKGDHIDVEIHGQIAGVRNGIGINGIANEVCGVGDHWHVYGFTGDATRCFGRGILRDMRAGLALDSGSGVHGDFMQTWDDEENDNESIVCERLHFDYEADQPGRAGLRGGMQGIYAGGSYGCNWIEIVDCYVRIPGKRTIALNAPQGGNVTGNTCVSTAEGASSTIAINDAGATTTGPLRVWGNVVERLVLAETVITTPPEDEFTIKLAKINALRADALRDLGVLHTSTQNRLMEVNLLQDAENELLASVAPASAPSS